MQMHHTLQERPEKDLVTILVKNLDLHNPKCLFNYFERGWMIGAVIMYGLKVVKRW